MIEKLPEEIIGVQPRGQCAGVIRAINHLRDRVKEHPGETVYCVNRIVHNKNVVASFEAMGVEFIKTSDLEDLPRGSRVVFSAHGVSPAVIKLARQKDLDFTNAVCPLVTKIHNEAASAASKNKLIVYIGKPKHDEAEGTRGVAPDRTTIVYTQEDAKALALPKDAEVIRLTQTTLSKRETDRVDATLKEKFGDQISYRKDLCYATTDRQLAIEKLVEHGVGKIVIVGSSDSHNSIQLKEVALENGVPAFLIDTAEELTPEMYMNVARVGFSAGASVDTSDIEVLINRFIAMGVRHSELIIDGLMQKEAEMDKMIYTPVLRV